MRRKTVRGPGARLSVRLAALFATVCAVFLLMTGGEAGAAGEPAPVAEVAHVVSPGETLWSIARSHAGPGEDIRVLVGEIKDASGLEGAAIHPGDVLRLPRR